MSTVKPLGLAFLLGLCCLSPLSADTWSLPDLMKELRQVPQVRARFTETKTLDILDQPLVSGGNLVYRAPDYVEKRITSPEPSHFIVSGDELTMSDAQNGEHRVILFQFPALQAFVEAVRATLAGDLPALREHYQVRLSGERNGWTLHLQPTQEEMQTYVKQINIRGQGDQVLEFETIETNNDRSVMRINPLSE